MENTDMHKAFLARDYRTVITLAQERIGSNNDDILAIRFLGLSLLFKSYGEGIRTLGRAVSLGDEYSLYAIQAALELKLAENSNIDWSLLEYSIQLQKLRNSKYMHFPKEVILETQAVCNAACTFCPYPTMERKGDKMSRDLISKVIDDLKKIPADLPFNISPFKMSDPFVDKRIFDISKEINEKLPNAYLRFFTNGAPLTDKNISKLVEIDNVSDLWISLNESDSFRYEKLMGIPFDRTISRLDSLHEFLKNGYPHKVTVSRVQDGTINDHRFLDFVSTRYPLFRVQISKVSNWLGQVDIDLLDGVPPLGCTRWFEINIMASGLVALCCMDAVGNYTFGDVSTDSVLDIYNSPGYKKMRQYLSNRNGAAAPCNDCNL